MFQPVHGQYILLLLLYLEEMRYMPPDEIEGEAQRHSRERGAQDESNVMEREGILSPELYVAHHGDISIGV